MSPPRPPPPDHLTRVATLPFRLGRPESLLASSGGPVQPASRRAGQVRQALGGPGCRTDLPYLLAAATAVRRRLPEVAGEPVGDDPAESPANCDNDLMFGIVRVHGPAVELLLDAAVTALIGVLEVAVDRGSGLDERSWRRLLGGFDVLFGWLADPGSVPDQPPVALPAGPVASDPDDGLRRWVRGHHVFMVFSQGGALALRRLQDRARQRDPAGAAAAAATATGLMSGAEGALRYAADADREQYLSQIRPTLMPPVAPPRMSGLRWRDHEALVRVLDGSTEAWRWLCERRPQQLASFRAALDQTYAAHQGVCRQFVGDGPPSLLAASGSARSAVGVLAQFRRLRLEPLPEPVPAGDEFPPASTRGETQP